MKPSFRSWQFLVPFALLASTTAAAKPQQLKLERVVILMRHGVRPPTKEPPIPVQYAPLPWPAWPVKPGLLTPHGAMGIARIAAADRAWLIDAGIIPAVGCPAPGQVTALASKTPRAIATAETWVANALPNCGITVQHPGKDEPDLLFHILETKPWWFDGHRAYVDALAQAPKGSLELQMLLLAPDMQRMGDALACAEPCPLDTEATTLVEQPHEPPKFHGPFDYAATASESFLLEYDEGMPMSSVAWGRATRADIEGLMIFNVTKLRYLNRTPYIARSSGGPLAKIIVNALNAPTGPSLTILGGHDTNIAAIGGMLDLHWQVPTYRQDDVPPGSALGFELVTDSKGHQLVRAFFRSQTMDQLRNLTPLNSDRNQAYREYLQIPGCGKSALAGCDLVRFTKLVEARLR
jgi:4-phytase/acid phosphatase